MELLAQRLKQNTGSIRSSLFSSLQRTFWFLLRKRTDGERESETHSDQRPPIQTSRQVRRSLQSTAQQDITLDSSAPEKSHLHAKQRRPSTIDQATLDSIVRYVKKHRSVIVTPQEKADIILLHAKLRHEHHTATTKTNQARKVKGARVTARIAYLLNCKTAVVAQVWSDYCDGVVTETARNPANYKSKTTRIPCVNATALLVQKFVRDRRAQHQRTVAKDVMEVLVNHGYLQVNCDSPKELAAALRASRRFLAFLGFKRGKKKGSMHYRLREENIRKRDQYISTMRHVNAEGVQRVVYLDESCIHHNYARHDDSLFAPNDEQDLLTVVRHKGRRYCFIAAILDCDRAVPISQRTLSQEARLIAETLNIFVGGKRQTVDYHGMFDGDYFESWMSTLLAALDEQGVKNAMIVLDNAKYHKRFPKGTPSGAMKKQVLRDKCTEYGIAYHEHDLKKSLWSKLCEYVIQNVVPVVVQMAKEKGHTVVFTPPRHSDLQPIETVWAIIKGEAGRQYTSTTTFQQVRDRLANAFANLKPSTVQGCIDKANRNLESLHLQLRMMEDDEESSDNGSSSNKSSSNHSDSD